ncbi:MAG: hypothetical protein SNF33_04720 [Candidatus Algichlamydia australiensis]|nr:hypothetical protein [Chlamydiales bacterium]
MAEAIEQRNIFEKSLDLCEATVGGSNPHSKLANLVQKSAISANYLGFDPDGATSAFLNVSSMAKVFMSPFLSARHVALFCKEIFAFLKVAGEYFSGETVTGEDGVKRKKHTFESLVIGKSRETLTAKKVINVAGKLTPVKDAYNEHQSLMSIVLRLSKCMQKLQDFAGIVYYSNMSGGPFVSNAALGKFNKAKSISQVFEYTIGLYWDRKMIRDGHKEASYFDAAGSFSAVAASGVSSFSFIFLDKKSSLANKLQGAVCFFAVMAAVIPFAKDFWNMDNPPKKK